MSIFVIVQSIICAVLLGYYLYMCNVLKEQIRAGKAIQDLLEQMEAQWSKEKREELYKRILEDSELPDMPDIRCKKCGKKVRMECLGRTADGYERFTVRCGCKGEGEVRW